MATNSLQNMQLDALDPIHFVESVQRHNRTENSQPSKWMEFLKLVAAKRKILSMPFKGHRMQQTQHRSYEIYQAFFCDFSERKCSLTIIFNVSTVITHDPKNAKTDFLEVQTGKFSMTLTLSRLRAIFPFHTTNLKHLVSSHENCVFDALAVKLANLNLSKTSRMWLRCSSKESLVMIVSSWCVFAYTPASHNTLFIKAWNVLQLSFKP